MHFSSLLFRSLIALVLIVVTSSAALAQANEPTLDTLPRLGIEALELQAASGDPGAALILGRLLSDRARSAEEHAAAVGFLQQASDAGLVEASVRLADILRSGLTGVPSNRPKAVELYELGVAAGDNNARRNLAYMLLSGQGTPKDAKRAAGLMQDASNAGNVDARVALAGLNARGEGVPVDPDHAIALYLSGIADRNRGAINGLASLYRLGAPGLAPAPELALSYYKVGAELGDTGSVRSLADMTIRGEGGPVDVDGAIGMLEALGQTDPGAFANIGDYYMAGQVVPRDAERAASYFEMAADAGNASALAKLGDLYRSGAGTVDIDASRAYAYYVRASSLGDVNAARKAADMQARGEGTTFDLALATGALESLGDAGSLVALGDLYSRGEATSPDLPRAIAYYEAAATAGNAGALVKIADLYRNGTGGAARDGERAVTFYEQAIAAGDTGARRTLAAMYIDGRLVNANADRAIELLEAGIAAGDAQAGIELGYAYARGALGEPDLTLVNGAFDAAASRGNSTAEWRKHVAILNGPLGEQAGADSSAALLQLASKTPAAAVELARLMVGGKVPDAGPAEGIELLQSANTDVGALRYLLQLYREGVRDRLRPNPAAAEALIESAANVLGPDATRFERVLLNASLADAARYPAIADDFRALTRNSGVSAIHRLRQVNQNAYVYVVQQWLADTGRYSGSLNGTLTQSTIAAFNLACADAGKAAECSKGPLSSEAATVIASFIYLPKAPKSSDA